MSPRNKKQKPLRILLLEDNPSDAELVRAQLKQGGVVAEIQLAHDEQSYRAALAPELDVIISDFRLPQFDAEEALRVLHEQALDVPFIVVSGTIGDEMAVALMKAGAADYLLKDRLHRLPQAVQRVVASHRNELEKTQTLGELSTLQGAHSLILQSIGEGVLGLDLAGKIVFENPAALEMLGWDDGSALGTSCWKILGLETAASRPTPEAKNAPIHATLTSGKIRAVKHGHFVRQDGSKFAVEYLSAPLQNSAGERIGAVVTFRNIGERLAADRELRRTERLLRELSDAMPQIVWANQPNGELDYVNAQTSLYSGQTLEELQQGWQHLLHPEDRAGIARRWQKVGQSGETFEAEVRLLRGRDQTYRWHLARAVAVRDADGQIIRWLGTATDIDDRKRVERELTQAQELASVGNWSHEIASDRLRWSDELYRIFGVDRETFALSFETMLALVDPQDRALMRGGRRTPSEYHQRIHRPNGEMRWVHVRSSVELAPDGKPIRSYGTVQDVTETRRAAEALREQEQRYRLLFQGNPSPMWVYDRDTLRFLEVNESAVQNYGYSREEFASMTILDIRPAEDVERLRQVLASAEADEPRLWRHCYKDGTMRLVETSYSSIAYHDRPGRLVLALDVTDRQRALRELRRSEENLARAQSISRVGSWEMNLGPVLFDDHLLHWSAETFRIFGYEPDEFEASEEFFYDRVHPDDRERVREAFAAAIRDQSAYDLEHRIVWPDGRERIVREIAQVVGEDGPGKGSKVVGVVQDITERKSAERRLREQAEMLNLAQDAIIVRSHADHRVIFWNRGAERLFGWRAKEAVGQHMDEEIFNDPEDLRVFSETIENEGVFQGEINQLTKEGRRLTVSARANLIRENDGTPRSILSIHTDITEHKKLQEQFLRAQRLESIGTLASGVAHDLNNILAPILMSAPMLREEMPDALRGKLLDTIEKSAERGAQIVKQVLTFARGAEGERVLLDATHLLKEMSQIAEQTFPKNIRISLRYPDDLWPLEGDPTQLHQVLLNLSVNARDSMPNGGTLLFAAENLELDSHFASMVPGANTGPHVLISVSDSGEGMSRATMDKIFDPFFTTKEIGKGTGLGLSTALGIVKAQSGFITVESELGNGTTFKVYFPAKSGHLVATPAPAALPEGNDELILVVDDEPSILAVTRMLLEKGGYRVLPARDGPEALALFAGQMAEVDLVITDMMMPFMDGASLIRSMQRMKPRTQFIASSGQGEIMRAEELRSLGVTCFITKPYNRLKLLSAVRETLDATTHELDGVLIR